MLPSRTRLQGWNPAALADVAPGITSSGASIEAAVATVAANCRSMPEFHAWSGESHDAATAAFDRSKRPAATIADAAEAIGEALVIGSHSVGTARTMLLDKSAAIESGLLRVTDSWVVLLKPVAMTRAEAAELQTLQAAAQVEIDRLLVAVGDADDETAKRLTAAVERFGFAPPGQGQWFDALVTTGSARPPDDVADPRTPMALLAQKQAAATDAAITVASKTEGVRADGTTETVITMQDGSRREILEWKDKVPERGEMPRFFDGSAPVTGSSETTYDPDEHRVMTVSSSTSAAGTTRRVVTTDGSGVVAFIGQDGKKTGWTFHPDGSIDQDLPSDAPFFTHPVLTATGGGMSGLEKFAESSRGAAAFGENASKIAVGMKYGGPALGLATTVFDMAVADNQYEACRAMYAGVAGTIGGTVSGTVGGIAGAAVGGLGAPAGAAAGTIGGTWIFGKLGDEIGQMVCAK